jgi:tetratricopeptide (TPR) repeat protein
LFLAATAALAQDPAPVQVPPAATQSAPDDLSSAEAAIAAADWKTAETKLDTWLAAHADDARALFDAGYVADAQDRLDDAASLYRRATQANPQSFEAHLSLGLLLARQKNFDEAHTELAAATALDSAGIDPALKARGWRALARIDRATDPAAASNDLIQALKISPETTDDILLAAELAGQTGQDKEAEAAYRRVLAADPQSSAATAGLVHLLIERKQYAEAEEMLRAALAKSPDDPALTAQLATVLANQDKAEALPLLEKLHEAHPGDNAITRMLASVLADAGDYASADALDVKLLAITPQDASLLVSHGQNLVRQTLFDQAFTVFEKATEIDPANADGWSGLAFAASRTNHPDVTLHALTERSKLLPENATTLFLWATAYDSLHQKEQAANYYRQFLNASAGKYPNQEWQARQRLQVLGTK